jgi:hypothetical protein
MLLVLKAEQMRRPSEFLTNVYRSNQCPTPLRIAAATAAAPYLEARCTDPPIAEPVPLLEPKTAADAEHNIATIAYYEATGRIGHASAAALAQRQKDWIEAHIISSIQIDAKAAMRALEEKEVLTKLQIYSGLPSLPLGEKDAPVIMPGDKDPPPDDSNPWGNGE